MCDTAHPLARAERTEAPLACVCWERQSCSKRGGRRVPRSSHTAYAAASHFKHAPPHFLSFRRRARSPGALASTRGCKRGGACTSSLTVLSSRCGGRHQCRAAHKLALGDRRRRSAASRLCDSPPAAAAPPLHIQTGPRPLRPPPRRRRSSRPPSPTAGDTPP